MNTRVASEALVPFLTQRYIPQELAAELGGFARQEPPVSDFWTLLFMPTVHVADQGEG